MKKQSVLVVLAMFAMLAFASSARAEKMIWFCSGCDSDVRALGETESELEKNGYELSSEAWSQVRVVIKLVKDSTFEIKNSDEKNSVTAYKNGLSMGFGGDYGYVISIPVAGKKNSYNYYGYFKEGAADDASEESLDNGAPDESTVSQLESSDAEEETEIEKPPAPPKESPKEVVKETPKKDEKKPAEKASQGQRAVITSEPEGPIIEYLNFGKESDDVNLILKMFNFEVSPDGWQKVCVLPGYPKENGKSPNGKKNFEFRFNPDDCTDSKGKNGLYTVFTSEGKPAGVTIALETKKQGVYGLYGRIDPNVRAQRVATGENVPANNSETDTATSTQSEPSSLITSIELEKDSLGTGLTTATATAEANEAEESAQIAGPQNSPATRAKSVDISGLRRVVLEKIAGSDDVDAMYKEVAEKGMILVYSIDGNMVVAKKGPACLSTDEFCKPSQFDDRDPLYIYDSGELKSLVLYNRAVAAKKTMTKKGKIVACYELSEKIVDNFGGERVLSKKHDVCGDVDDFPICDRTKSGCIVKWMDITGKKILNGVSQMGLCRVFVKDSKKYPNESAIIEAWRADYCLGEGK